ncbi:MAG: carbohydrate ABC transporter permease [Acholeplasmatales bacterium]|nr:carbohydrate ABC transporter permease [Acholeplasmatales bacterium]
MMNQNTSAKIKLIVLRTITYSFLIFMTILCLIFFYIMLVNASKSHKELLGNFKPYFSTHLIENMIKTFKDTSYVNVPKGMLNSFIIASLTAILTTYFSALSAYAVHTYRFKGRKFISTFILAIMMIPSQVTSVGFLQLAYQFNLTDNIWMLILPSIAAPSVYFYMIQYLKATLPLDLVEASRMDGSSEFMTFNRIVLPIMKPALSVQLIFSFVASWNNFYMPSLLLHDDEIKTLPVMISALRSAANSQVDAGLIWMVVLLSVLPVLLVYLFLSKSIIKGVTSGSVKG